MRRFCLAPRSTSWVAIQFHTNPAETLKATSVVVLSKAGRPSVMRSQDCHLSQQTHRRRKCSCVANDEAPSPHLQSSNSLVNMVCAGIVDSSSRTTPGYRHEPWADHRDHGHGWIAGGQGPCDHPPLPDAPRYDNHFTTPRRKLQHVSRPGESVTRRKLQRPGTQ